ncbi:MAG TPA: polyphosphate kinase 1, partial [Longimicrobiaceae bacterium]
EVPRLVALPDGERFVPLEEVIRAHLDEVYPGTEVLSASLFRVTRSAELHIPRDGEADDLLRRVEEELAKRPFRPAVRLEVEKAMPLEVRALLLRELRSEARGGPELDQDDVFPVNGMVDLRSLREVVGLPRPELHYPPFEAAEPLDPGRSVFDVLQEREVMVHFPYDSFEGTVERFLLEAAEDPEVVAIRLALYRTNRSSRIVEALRRASETGKEVVALVELTARFDEQRNVEWARYLQASGIRVVYGVPGWKIHAKVALVERREGEEVRRYAYLGTGNLNAATAGAYTDLGLLTRDPELGEEVARLFDALTGKAGEPRPRRLLVAPFNMRSRFLELLERETEHARAGRGGHVRIKINGLADREMIAALYRASCAGVRVELIVRGLCALRPGVAGLSENVRVYSLLGRFLEHARIYRFENAGSPEHFIGSADWRTRNLSRRVEVVAPVREPEHRARLDRILDEQLAHPDAWELGSDGSYYRRPDAAPHAASTGGSR